MRLQMPETNAAPERPPGDPPETSTATRPLRTRRIRHGRFATIAGVSLALGLCAVAGCALFVPGFVLGAEAPTTTAALPDPEPSAPVSTGQPVDRPGALSTGTLLVTLPWGSGPGEVGLTRPAEGLTRGPEALAVAPSGRIAVLDSVNKRVLFLDGGGRALGTTDLALAEPRFVAVDDDRLYVLDCDADRQVLVLGWDGAVLGSAALPELPDVVTGLFATEAGPCFEVAHDGVFLLSADAVATSGPDARAAASSRGESPRPLAGRPLDRSLSRLVKVSFAPTSGLRMRAFRVDRTSLKATKLWETSPSLAPGRMVEHLVSVDGDGGEGLVVGARVLEPAARSAERVVGVEPAALLLTRFDSKGSRRGPADELILAESNFAYLGQPYVVAPDGRILQPVADESGYSILVHSFAPGDRRSATEEVLP